MKRLAGVGALLTLLLAVCPRGSAQTLVPSPRPVNLFTTKSATATQTSALLSAPTFSQSGTLIITWASITGSPATCTFQVKSADSLGNLLSNGAAISVSPSNGTTSQVFAPASSLVTSAQMEVVYSCGTYPTAGTLSLDFAPTVPVLPFWGSASNLVSGCTSAMTGTTSTSLLPAPASGLHNYITSVTVGNSSSSVSTFVALQDGSGGSTIWEYPAADNFGGAAPPFPAPLRQPTAANALYVADVTTGANVIVCASGYTAP